MNIGEKISILRKQKGISPEKLGLLVGISGIYIRRLEKGERNTITLGTAQKLARGLEVTVADLLEGNRDVASMIRRPESALSDLEVSIKAYIPVYAEVSAGEGMEPIDYVACTRAKPAPETLRAYRVKGLCLEDEVRDGDTLIVDTGLQPDPGNLVVVIIDGQASVKRFKGDHLENNHGTYKPEDVYIHGVVVEISRKMR